MVVIALAIPVIIISLYWLYMSPFSQLFGKFPYKAKTKEKVIALTFDDGPNDPFTSELLDYLAKEKIKATFFVVGNAAEQHPLVVKRIITDGHVIGNHSMSHRFTNYFRDPTFAKEIIKNQEILHKLTGKKPALFRPPWLMRQPALLKTVKKLDMHPVGGEFCSNLEVFQVASQKIAQDTMKKIRPGSIIIFHDGYDGKGGNRRQTIDAVKLLVPELKKAGYTMTTVDKLLKIPAYQQVVK